MSRLFRIACALALGLALGAPAAAPAVAQSTVRVALGTDSQALTLPRGRSPPGELPVDDLPRVVEWARAELPGNVKTLGADVLAEPSCGVEPGSADTVLISHLLHDLTDGQCLRVLRGARAALAPGGRVVIVEIPGDSPGTMGPLFDLMMQVETPGRARTPEALRDLLAIAGLSGIREAAYPRPVLVLVGETG